MTHLPYQVSEWNVLSIWSSGSSLCYEGFFRSHVLYWNWHVCVMGYCSVIAFGLPFQEIVVTLPCYKLIFKMVNPAKPLMFG